MRKDSGLEVTTSRVPRETPMARGFSHTYDLTLLVIEDQLTYLTAMTSASELHRPQL